MQKTLSIIIPTYNMHAYLPACLNSLCLRDTNLLAALDIIVINDGSTDNTHDIAQSFINKHPSTFRIIDKPNGHYGSCINRGLREATGTFVRILDADDQMNMAGLEKLLLRLAEIQEASCGIDAVISDYQKISEDQRVVATETAPFAPNAEISLSDLARCPYDRQMHAITYRRSIFDNLNYKQTEGIAYTDTEWMFLPMTNVRKLTYLNSVVYKYLTGRAGQSMDPNVTTKQFDMFYRTLYAKVREYTLRKTRWPRPALEYAQSQLSREVANLIYLCLKVADQRLLMRLDELLNHELKEIQHLIGFDGALFVNPFFKFLFAKGCCQHKLMRPLMRLLIK